MRLYYNGLACWGQKRGEVGRRLPPPPPTISQKKLFVGKFEFQTGNLFALWFWFSFRENWCESHGICGSFNFCRCNRLRKRWSSTCQHFTCIYQSLFEFAAKRDTHARHKRTRRKSRHFLVKQSRYKRNSTLYNAWEELADVSWLCKAMLYGVHSR